MRGRASGSCPILIVGLIDFLLRRKLKHMHPQPDQWAAEKSL